jgi:DNA polymerase-3 subunit epsilon
MRQLILDTETTGLDHRQDHRIIEIAAVELVDRRPTGRHLHVKINPEREIDVGATEVHGMTWDDLRDKKPFRDVAEEFIAFARGAEWVIHNAPFDVGFLDAELARLTAPCCCNDLASGIVDTLSLAREMFPGKRNNLDALCERFAVDNAERTLHGALLDAQLLAEVYLALTRGQESLAMELPKAAIAGAGLAAGTAGPRPAILVVAPSEDELAAHHAYLEALEAASRGRCVWLALDREIGQAA